MITLTINDVPTLFIKAFTGADVSTILEFVRRAANLSDRGGEPQVLFIDTPITRATVEAVEKLAEEGYQVIFRDHHGIDGEPANDREGQVVASTEKLRRLLGDDCLITVRRLHPACSTLVSAGEFASAVAIIADPDADGLTAAMKAAGVTYPGLDEDAALLDGEPQFQVTGTPLSQLLAKGMAVLPSYDPARPKDRLQAQQKLFEDWFKAVSGNEAARQRLAEQVVAYDAAADVSRRLAATATTIAPGVVLVDAVDSAVFDPGTLNALLENDPACLVSVVRKSLGPIAAHHGTQYSLTVPKAHQQAINLHDLIPAHAMSSPEAGIISNVSFLLHVSEDVWKAEVLPRLAKLSWTP